MTLASFARIASRGARPSDVAAEPTRQNHTARNRSLVAAMRDKPRPPNRVEAAVEAASRDGRADPDDQTPRDEIRYMITRDAGHDLPPTRTIR